MNIPVIKKKLIETERLTIRPFEERDLDGLTELLTDPGITETFMVPDYETKEEYAALARKLIGFSRIEDTAHLDCGICLNDRVIGFINDCGIEGDEIEIGYVIHPRCKGMGYASEAVRAILPELRAMGFKTVKAGYFEENAASRRVMEKCGMRPTGEEDSEEYRGRIRRTLYCAVDL